jgi:hypothetical protein
MSRVVLCRKNIVTNLGETSVDFSLFHRSFASLSSSIMRVMEELDSPAVSALGVRWRKLSNVGRASDG